MSQTEISSQMFKGILQGCLLILINKHHYYGYAISQELLKYGFTDIPRGTIYPLLTSMEKKGLIVGKVQPSSVGPQRKYYYITDTGKQAKKIFLYKWNKLSLSVNNLINERKRE